MDTPSLSKTVKDLSTSDQELIKAGLNRYGNTVLKPTKTGTDHLFDTILYDETVYFCRSTGIINSGDTLTDSESNVFTVTLMDSAIDGSERSKIYISGSIAYVNIDINY